MPELSFFIPGRPVPKARPRVGAGGRVFTPKRTREYEELVAWTARTQPFALGSAPVKVRIVLRTQRPLTGDIDNYAKAILDGMVTGQMMVDDSQVVELAVQFVVDPGDEEGATVYVDAVSSGDCPYCAPDEPCALHL